MKLLLSTTLVLTAATSLGQFTFYDLHPTGASSSRYAGTYKGISVGHYTGPSGTRALVWTGESFIDVTPAGATARLNGTIGNRHVGWANLNGYLEAGYWVGNNFNSLHPGGNYTYSVARGLDGNQQVGYADRGGEQHAMVWHGNAISWTDLHPNGYLHSWASAVYEHVQVGTAVDQSGRRAAMWRDTADSFVDLHLGGYVESGAIDIDRDVIVGWATAYSNVQHAVVWDANTGVATVVHPSWATESVLNGVYDGIAVGEVSGLSGEYYATIWFLDGMFTLDLSQFMPSGYSYSAAFSVWKDGNDIIVAGQALHDATGETHGVIWVSN